MVYESSGKGYARAERDLGYMYEYGKGIEQDYEKAVQWYTKAAEKGYETAECNLGNMYEYGKGIEQDYEKAVQWYMKAAEKGDETAETPHQDPFTAGALSACQLHFVLLGQQDHTENPAGQADFPLFPDDVDRHGRQGTLFLHRNFRDLEKPFETGLFTG